MGVKMFDDPIKVAENEKAIFYVSDSTKGVESYAKSKAEVHRVKLKELRCLIAESKEDGEKEYVVIYDGEYAYASQKYEQVGAHVDMIVLNEQNYV